MENGISTYSNQVKEDFSTVDESLMNKTGKKNPQDTVSREEVLRKKNYYNSVINSLRTEGGIYFMRYIKSLGLLGEPNMMVLSSRHHYYYDENDCKGVKVIVNLKKLNQIKYLDLFLNSLSRILPDDSGFIGYFSACNTFKGNFFLKKWIFNLHTRLKNLFSSETDYYLNEYKVSELLKKNGLTIVNMIRMNGLIFFYSTIDICSQIDLNSLQFTG
jgi:hypothetical protein